jgi:hypothetical protein
MSLFWNTSASIQARLTASSADLRSGEAKMTWICEMTRRSRRQAGILLGLGSVLMLAACASTPPAPALELSSAKQAIAAADQTRVADAASPELSEARDKLASAQTAVQDKHMVEAQRLAVESRVDAELASAYCIVGRAGRQPRDDSKHQYAIAGNAA